MADQGADTDLMPAKVHDMMMSIAPDTQVVKFQPPLLYTGITNYKFIHCSRQIDVNFFLKV